MADFKVLAVRILPDCKSCIRKVLREDRWYLFYKFYKDYEITQGGWLKKKCKSKVPADFYRVPEFSPNISVSTIVGKSG